MRHILQQKGLALRASRALLASPLGYLPLPRRRSFRLFKFRLLRRLAWLQRYRTRVHLRFWSREGIQTLDAPPKVLSKWSLARLCSPALELIEAHGRLQIYSATQHPSNMAAPAILSLPTPSPSLPSTPGPLAPATPPAGTPPAVPTSVGLAQRLRDSTAQAHQDVMMPAVVHKLVKGQLSRSLHLRYLMLLHGVYSALEDALAAHATHPCLSGVYNPALLSRAGALESDCEYYTGEREWSAKSDEGRALQKDKPDAVKQYEARLRGLGEKEEGETGERSPTLLLAHAYVRYREYIILASSPSYLY